MNAVKEIESPPDPGTLRIVSVMSVPMCGWNPHWECHHAALRPLGLVKQITTYGAWWDHGICNAFEDILDYQVPVDWVLTMDYDSMFTADQVSRLCRTFGENPHIDALSCLQPRRGGFNEEETPLMTVEAKSDTVIEFTDQPIKAATAHFGLTLFRVESIRKMPRPMMIHRPDPNGSYRTKARLDPDMYFWHKWNECGNTLYVDPLVSIGHLQAMVAELLPDDDGHLRTKHCHVMDWRKRGVA